jgi:2-polyprenyl-6-methoxyphenol hydroxylase-like FAD-dependent oxidoreductase
MALEDAGTLANALGLSLEERPVISSVEVRESLRKWQTHRQERVAKITAFSARGGDMRRPTANVVQQVLREWTMWAVFWWAGSVERMKWIYKYDIHDALL